MEPSTKESVDSTKDVDKNNSVSVIISNPKILDCHDCLQPLTTPVFQCKMGHIVCFDCKNNHHRHKCSIYSMGITLERCRVIENLLQCIEIPCPNEKNGCREKISYSRKRKHEEECIYGPCHCPHSGCNFVAFPEVLYKHFSHKHPDSQIKFSYGCSFTVPLKPNNETVVLQEKNYGKLFILSNISMSVGNAVNINIIDSISSKSEHRYDISARSQKCSMKLRASPNNVQRVTSATLSPECLMIPSGYFGSSTCAELEICITTKMQIFIQTMPGKKIMLKVDSLDTIASVKEKIVDENVHLQCLYFDGKKLSDIHTIADYNIQEKSTLRLIVAPPPLRPPSYFEPLLFNQYKL